LRTSLLENVDKFVVFDNLMTHIEQRVNFSQAYVAPSGTNKTSHHHDAGAMEVDALGKGGKAGNKNKNKNKDSGGKAGNKNKSKSDKDKTKTKTKQNQVEGIHGYCGYCGKWGHKKGDCRSNPANGGAGKPVHEVAVEKAPVVPVKALQRIEEEQQADFDSDDQWMMGLTACTPKNVHALGLEKNEELILIDSGSATTGGPWSFGDGYDVITPTSMPNFENVSGTAINYYGQRKIPGTMTDIDGETVKLGIRSDVMDAFYICRTNPHQRRSWEQDHLNRTSAY
jgi:hypothetical protein